MAASGNMAGRSMPSADENYQVIIMVWMVAKRLVRVRATCCKSIIAAHAECYLFCGKGGRHGVAPCRDPELPVQRAT